MSKIFYHSLGSTETWPTLSGIHPATLTYDDVLLLPQYSSVPSRAEVDTSVHFGPYKLRKPIISAPMDTITGEAMIRELARLGAIGTLPRGDLRQRLALCAAFSKEHIPCVYAVGLKNGVEEARQLKKKGAQIILVDVAHGGLDAVKEVAAAIKKLGELTVIAGNIVSYLEATAYQKANIDIARVGVGPGGLCSTRVVAGNGFPQLSAVFETTTVGIPVIADGGIKEPGHMAKAIAAGATLVMIGSLFAGTEETPGELIDGKKQVRGQASASYMKDQQVQINEFRAAEGVSIEVSNRGLVSHVIEELMGGLRSAMSYAGAQTIKEFQEKAQFVPISQAAYAEGKPWLASLSK